MNSTNNVTAYRMATLSAYVTLFGIIFSGPLALLVVSIVQQQPPWESVQAFVENYHDIQSLPFYFGFLLIAGSIVMIAALYELSERQFPLLVAVLFTTVGGTLIFFNYFTQTTFVPALVREYSQESAPIISSLTMANPTSLAWAVEMWGYGFIGLGSWFAAAFFSSTRLERIASTLFIVNGVVSILGALWTSVDLGWVLTPPGIMAFSFWNILYLAMVILLIIVIRKRKWQN